MRIYPAVHYTMGGLWVDYNLMSNVPGLACDRRSEFFRSRRQPARCQRAHARFGRRLFRFAVHAAELSRRPDGQAAVDRIVPNFEKRRKVFAPGSKNSSASTANVRSIHFIASLVCFFGTNAEWRETPRDCAKRSNEFPELREEFWREVRVPGNGEDFNQSLERAGRVADFLEFAELMCIDALDARRIMRRPFSRRTSNRRWRSVARRRKPFRRCLRLGISRRWSDRRPNCIASRSFRNRASDAEEL